MPITRNPRPTHAAASPQRPGQPEYVIATPLTLRAKPPRAKTPNGVENRRPHGEGRKGGKVEAKAKLAVVMGVVTRMGVRRRVDLTLEIICAVRWVALRLRRQGIDSLACSATGAHPVGLHSPLSLSTTRRKSVRETSRR